MKVRLSALAVLLVLAFALGGCGLFGRDDVSTPPPIAVTPSPTPKVEVVASEAPALPVMPSVSRTGTTGGTIYGDGWVVFGVTAPDDTYCVKFTVWSLENGDWTQFLSDTYYVSGEDTEGSVAVSFDPETAQLAYSSDLGGGSAAHSPEQLADTQRGWGVTALDGEVPLELDEPVALMLMSASDTGSLSMYPPQLGFEQPESFAEGQTVFAFTLEFGSDSVQE